MEMMDGKTWRPYIQVLGDVEAGGEAEEANGEKRLVGIGGLT